MSFAGAFSRSNAKFGFTLVELTYVVAVLGVLSTTMMPYYRTSLVAARMTEGIAGVGAIRTALRIHAATRGQYPVLTNADGNQLGVLRISPSDLDGKYFSPEDYEVFSNGVTYQISVTYAGDDLLGHGANIPRAKGGKDVQPGNTEEPPKLTYIIDETGTELGTFTTRSGQPGA